MNPYFLRRISLFWLAILAINCAGCRFYHEYKQFITFRDMAITAEELDRIVGMHGLDLDKMNTAVSRMNKGRDAWGNELIIYLSADKKSYVLVSLGSDGESEFESAEEYLLLTARMIHQDPTADLVFRDGIVITNAGK
jgi:hypothetical protein